MEERNFFIIVIFCGFLLGPTFYFMRLAYLERRAENVIDVEPKHLEIHGKNAGDQVKIKE